ncbi:hypothetical protein ACNPQM_42870 [Streptomyces sp. NPDC056231]|uniref:hypothetical protein n=1 Tax=Streptomyces sp. NPDC056231 TaxID=3345755 RepID=UPI003AAE0FEB
MCSARAATAARIRNVTIIEVRSAGQYRIDTVSAPRRGGPREQARSLTVATSSSPSGTQLRVGADAEPPRGVPGHGG